MQPQLTYEYLASQGMSPSFPKRFWEKVNKTNSCWIWTAATNNKGYGIIKPKFKINCILAHRASWILCNGPIPKGMNVLHDCPGGDNQRCVNPEHLWLGTIVENNRDMFAKGRGHVPSEGKDMSGGNNPSSKIKPETVSAMRNKFSSGGVTAMDISKEFGVSYSHTHRIINYQTWKNW